MKLLIFGITVGLVAIVSAIPPKINMAYIEHLASQSPALANYFNAVMESEARVAAQNGLPPPRRLSGRRQNGYEPSLGADLYETNNDYSPRRLFSAGTVSEFVDNSYEYPTRRLYEAEREADIRRRRRGLLSQGPSYYQPRRLFATESNSVEESSGETYESHPPRRLYPARERTSRRLLGRGGINLRSYSSNDRRSRRLIGGLRSHSKDYKNKL